MAIWQVVALIIALIYIAGMVWAAQLTRHDTWRTLIGRALIIVFWPGLLLALASFKV